MGSSSNSTKSRFIVFIRLPFPRGDFVDPPAVEWNAEKDQALWEVLSRPQKGEDVDWRELANDFDVTLQFLLQQAAWLYDRQLSQVRAQMRRVGTTHSNSPSPAPGSVSGSTAFGVQPMKRVSSSGARVPSRLANQPSGTATQKAAHVPHGISSGRFSQPTHPREVFRNITPTAETQGRTSEEAVRRLSAHRRELIAASVAPHRSPTLAEEDLPFSSSEDSTSEEEDVAAGGGAKSKRFGKFSTHRESLRDDDDDDEDDDESPAFLPLNRGDAPTSRQTAVQDMSATLRLDAAQIPRQRRRTMEKGVLPRSPVTTESSDSSLHSGAAVGMQRHDSTRRLHQGPSRGPISPGRAAELASLSPRRSVGAGKDTSDTPSMGSSFSDLDDASVTQSALEEALLSNMQQGGMASRMSSISQALRSRYL